MFLDGFLIDAKMIQLEIRIFMYITDNKTGLKYINVFLGKRTEVLYDNCNLYRSACGETCVRALFIRIAEIAPGRGFYYR